jgi:hypothetical protein
MSPEFDSARSTNPGVGFGLDILAVFGSDNRFVATSEEGIHTMRKFQILFSLAVLALVVMTTAAGAGTFTRSDNPATPNAATVTYDPATGALGYWGNGTLISTMELKSASSMFIPGGVNDGVISGPFDVMSTAKFFKLATDGVTGVDVGTILPPGLSADAIMADLQVDGSIKPSGKLDAAAGGGPYLYVNVVPEPSSVALVCCGLLGLLGLRRK